MLPSAAFNGASCVRERREAYGPAAARLPTVTDIRLLDADFGTADRKTKADSLQRALGQLASHQARLETALGEGLELLHSRFDIRELGLSHFDSLCTGKLGFSAAHGRELRKLHDKLPCLPNLNALFLAGLIPRSRLRVVLNVATPDDEAAWARLAMQLSTRELSKRVTAVKRAGSQAPAAGTDASSCDEEKVWVSWLGTAEERASWEFTLAALRQVVGKRGPVHELVDMLIAETLSDLPPVDDEAGCVRSEGGKEKSPARRSRGASRLTHRAPRLQGALRKIRRSLARSLSDAPKLILATPDFGARDSAAEVLEQLEFLVRRLTSIEAERARLLAWMHGQSLYHELGFPHFHAWLERRLGMSPREARKLMDLQSRLSLLPEAQEAWQDGSLTTHQARQVSRVATPDTEGDWTDYARTATPKLLDVAVEAVLIHPERGKTVSPGRGLLPPRDREYRELKLNWREHFGLRRRRARRARGGACASSADSSNFLNVEEPGRGATGGMSVGRIGFWAPPDVAKRWSDAQAAVRMSIGAVLSDADVVSLMIGHFLAVQVDDAVLAHAEAHRAMERDGWTCAMPHCRATSPLHEHHVRYRSRGGGDELSNLLTVCLGCHAMIHAGHAVVFAHAPGELTFLLGTRREMYRRGSRVAG